jgi:hypothetical protein
MSDSPLTKHVPIHFVAPPWVVTMDGDTLYRQKYLEDVGREKAFAEIETGKPAREVFGWSMQRLPITNVRRVAWVKSLRTVLIQRSWLRDPWRLKFDEEDASEQLFQAVVSRFSNPGKATESRVGPHDLEMDPGLALGVLLILFGFLALFGGAIEGAGQAGLVEPAQRFRFLTEIGDSLGLLPVILAGVVTLCIGLCAMIHWYRNRPMKWVIESGKS